MDIFLQFLDSWMFDFIVLFSLISSELLILNFLLHHVNTLFGILHHLKFKFLIELFCKEFMINRQWPPLYECYIRNETKSRRKFKNSNSYHIINSICFSWGRYLSGLRLIEFLYMHTYLIGDSNFWLTFLGVNIFHCDIDGIRHFLSLSRLTIVKVG